LITALAGGVGAAKFLYGVVRLIQPEDLTVIVNTADDAEIYGLHVSPDVDTVMYTLAGLADEEKGWGVRGDTFNFLEAMDRYGHDTWFRIGDRDLATHVSRTTLLRRGRRLSEVTRTLCKSLGVKSKVLPMTDERVETKVSTDEGMMDFQHYFVERGFKPRVRSIVFEGVEGARPAPGVLEALKEAQTIVICPSNPVVSIGPILALEGIRDAIRGAPAWKVAVSPIVKGAPLRGPADKLLRALGMEASALSVAEIYRDFLNAFVIDEQDSELVPKIRAMGLEVISTNTIMKNLEDSVRLAKAVLGAKP